MKYFRNVSIFFLLIAVILSNAETIAGNELEQNIDKLKSLVKNKQYTDSLILISEIRKSIEMIITSSSKNDVITIDLSQLENDIAKNAISVNNKYSGNKVTFLGTIDSMDNWSKNELRVSFICSNDGIIVMCFFDIQHQEYLSTFGKGDKVQVTGTFDKGDWSNVYVRDCSMIKVNN